MDYRSQPASRRSNRWPGGQVFETLSGRPNAKPKVQFAGWLRSTTGQTVDPDTIFDCQIKRIHEYKRQLLNALRVVVLYNQLRANPGYEDEAPHLFIFAGKATPAYTHWPR